MAKRFTDTDKWKRPWFNELDLKARFFWLYLLDNCDHRGVWFADFGLASYQVGFKVDQHAMLKWFGDKIEKIDEDKFFIPSFIEFQYGDLSETNNAHKPILKLLDDLKTQKQLAPKEPLKSPLLGAQDKDKDKDNSIKKVEKLNFDFESLFAIYPRKDGKTEGMRRIRSKINDQDTFDQFARAVRNYAHKCRMERTDARYIKHWSTFVGPADKDTWRDYIPDPPKLVTPAPVVEIPVEYSEPVDTSALPDKFKSILERVQKKAGNPA